MTTAGWLQERDLRALMAVIEEGRRDDPGTAGMPWAVLAGLVELIPCDNLGFSELDPHTPEIVIQQDLEYAGQRSMKLGVHGPRQNTFWAYFPTFRPREYRRRTGDLTSVLRWSDFYTTAELKNAPAYVEVFRSYGAWHHLGVELPTPTSHDRRLMFWRDSGADFSERDRLILQILRPHLIEVYLDADRRRRRLPHLSQREREVLELAAQGKSNADIAGILFISAATVRKHMEHIFDRTGVRNRAAAAALALPGVTPDKRPGHHI
jgi:DNA-binding CsgD family transcriptional regulator